MVLISESYNSTFGFKNSSGKTPSPNSYTHNFIQQFQWFTQIFILIKYFDGIICVTWPKIGEASIQELSTMKNLGAFMKHSTGSFFTIVAISGWDMINNFQKGDLGAAPKNGFYRATSAIGTFGGSLGTVVSLVYFSERMFTWCKNEIMIVNYYKRLFAIVHRLFNSKSDHPAKENKAYPGFMLLIWINFVGLVLTVTLILRIPWTPNLSKLVVLTAPILYFSFLPFYLGNSSWEKIINENKFRRRENEKILLLLHFVISLAWISLMVIGYSKTNLGWN